MYDRGHRSAVAIACAGAFLAFLDATIVNIAFPDISRSFAGSGRDALSWVLDGYFVVIAALLVPAGGLADRFGHKRIFLLGVGGFTAASLLCAVAPSLGLLIAFRVLQGIGAAMIAPTSLALVLDSFPPRAARRRRRPLGRRRGRRGGDRPDPGRRPGRALRLAPRLPRQPAARRRDRLRRPPPPARAPAARQPPARPARRAMLAAQPGPDHARRSSRATTGAGPRPRRSAASPPPRCCSPASSVRSRSHPRPIVEPELFPHGSFRIGNLGTLLFAAAFFSLILGNVLFLTSIWGYTVLQAGAATLPRPGRSRRSSPAPPASSPTASATAP